MTIKIKLRETIYRGLRVLGYKGMEYEAVMDGNDICIARDGKLIKLNPNEYHMVVS
jgi:hypothetical protein